MSSALACRFLATSTSWEPKLICLGEGSMRKWFLGAQNSGKRVISLFTLSKTRAVPAWISKGGTQAWVLCSFFGGRKCQRVLFFHIYLSPEEHHEESKISLMGGQRLNDLNSEEIALIWRVGVLFVLEWLWFARALGMGQLRFSVNWRVHLHLCLYKLK